MEKQKNDYLRIRLEGSIKKEYLKYCEKYGFTISKRIRLFIENELNNEKNERTIYNRS